VSNWIEHVRRNNGLEEVMEERMSCKRGPGRPRMGRLIQTNTYDENM